MDLARLRFRPQPIPALAVSVGVALFLNLGWWQAGKAERRQAEIAQFTQRAQLGPYRVGHERVDALTLQDAPVTVRGVFEPEHQILIDNRQENGKPGVHVVTPMRIEGGNTRVLVNRGWVGWGSSRAVMPQVATPAGPVQVNGIASIPSTKKFLLMPDREEAQSVLWNRLDLQRFAKRYPGDLQDFVILQDPADTADGLVRHWPAPEDRVAMHESYAMQWFGMATALIIFFCVASLRQRVER